MKSLLLLLILATFLHLTPAPDVDPCAPYPTCKDCVAHAFCGWCSSPVSFEDGTKGKNCAYQGQGRKPFVCEGTYQTETCLPEEFKCDNKTFQCKQVPFGSGGESFDKCFSTCLPPTYFCDKQNKICIKTFANGTSYEICNDTCIHAKKQFQCDTKSLKCVEAEQGMPFEICNSTCGDSKNVTPDSNVIGKWRGVQVNIGYKVGEWKLDILPTSEMTITAPDRSIWSKGILQTSGNEFWIREAKGIRRSIYLVNPLPTVKAMTWAIGSIGNPPPPDFDAGMRGKAGTTFVFWKCINEANCDFSHVSELVDQILASANKEIGDINDKCSVNPDCETCIADKTNKCGWCSTNVVYKNGTVIGKQCAGYQNDGTKDPWVCRGMYSTETCSPFSTTTSSTTTSTTTTDTSGTGTGTDTSTTSTTSTTGGGNDKWACDPKNMTCSQASSGFDRKNDCDLQCKENPGPVEILGTWRGIHINKGYITGEWKAVFTPEGVTVTRPDGDKFTAKVTTVSQYLVLTPTSGTLVGLKIQTLWQVSYGIETRLLTWAWGQPGGAPPKDYNSAMIEHGNNEFALTACLQGAKPDVCNFDH